jgi:prepilin-type N-terminal cleavage/methylation domain-containing protein
MTLRLAQAVNGRAGRSGFTLIEILIAFLIFGMVVSGLIYGYVQANRMAELSSMSLAAQSYASQGMEAARSAEWDSQMYPVTNGPGTGDEIRLFPSGQSATGHTNYSETDYMDVPCNGAPIPVTNYITVTNISIYPPRRQIRSDCVWTFPIDGKLCTNTVITVRAPDQ